MNTRRQFTLPFRHKLTNSRATSNRDLIGRSYRQDKWAMVSVIDVCVDDPGRVRVQRDVDGKTWTMPGWLMRLIFLEELKRAA